MAAGALAARQMKDGALGYRLGFLTPAECDAEAEVQGKLPSWLAGALVRVCPAIYQTAGGWRARHHFDGLAMLYHYRFGAGGSVRFRNRFLRTRQYEAAMRGERWGNEFAAPVTRSAWQWLRDPLPRMSDNTNINVCRIDGRYLALNESAYPYAFDSRTLGTIGLHRYDDDLSTSMSMGAHPILDPETGEHFNVGVRHRLRSQIYVCKVAPGTNRREVLATLKTRRPSWIHSFLLTAQSIILVLHPFYFDARRFAFTPSASVMECFDWEPGAGTEFVIIDRRSGQMRVHHADALLMIHAANAFEDDSGTVVDLLAYPDATVLTDVLAIPRDCAVAAPEVVNRPPYRIAIPLRFRLARGEADARAEVLFDVECEFPVINERAARGLSYRFFYAIGPDRSDSDGYLCRLHKFDLERRSVLTWGSIGTYLTEPSFVPNPQPRSEDDGVLLVPTLDGRRGISELVCLDAGSLEEIARARAPVALPFGFHGQFFAD